MNKYRLAQDINAMAYGKALYAISPVVQALGPEKREVVFRYLANEYLLFAASIEKLMERDDGE